MKANVNDFIGKKINFLTVVEQHIKPDSYTRRGVELICLCDCGQMTIKRIGDLRDGNAVSCGCKRLANATHRMTNSRTYHTWERMKARCYNTKDPSYSNYGGRDIKVCDRWLYSFENFYADMGERPRGTSLDRIKVNEDYGPSNCRYATVEQQQNNRRNNIYIEYNGETMTVAQWARRMGLVQSTLSCRLKTGWPIDLALTTTPNKNRKLETLFKK